MRSRTALGAAILLASVLAWTPGAHAAGAKAYNHPVSWTLPIEGFPACSQLPPGVSVNGDGTQHVTVHVTGDTEMVQSTATGKAVDSDGNRYQWLYVNHLEFNLVTGDGHFTDRFDLIGRRHAAGYTVYLDWDVTIDPSAVGIVPPEELIFFATGFDPIVTHGDINCDPL